MQIAKDEMKGCLKLKPPFCRTPKQVMVVGSGGFSTAGGCTELKSTVQYRTDGGWIGRLS